MLWAQVCDRAIVSVQQPIQLGEVSEPQPDVALLQPRADFYADHHPMPPDVLLLVEVADTSLRHDLARKAPIYLAGGVPEVWVVDLASDVVHVTRGAEVLQLTAGDTVSPLAFPDVVVDLAALLG